MRLRKKVIAALAICKITMFIVFIQAALLSPFGPMFGIYTLLAIFCAATVLY